MTQSWLPDISTETGSLPDRILAALRRDIASGDLAAGTRLPPQRDLAFKLGVSLGVVSRAYADAERRGLTSGQIGRGTYVLGALPPESAFTMTSASETLVDLARNYPPLAASQARMARTLAAFSQANSVDFCTYGPLTGLDTHRQSAARWLAISAGYEPDWRRIILTVGAQQAIDIALSTLLAPGDCLMCEAATFHGVKLAAVQARLKIVGLQMDEEGATPEALDRAAAAGARIAYLTPTLQNPTGRTMSATRREAIIEVARRRDLILIEDDIYAAYAGERLGDAPTPLAAMAPERVFYISGASKSLAPGLRVGFLIAPDELQTQTAAQILRASLYSTPVLGPAIFSHWVENGEAAKIATETRSEAAKRQAMAMRILGDHMERPASNQCLHLWLPLPELDAERVTARALRAGVEITPPSAPVVDPQLISGLRICLGQAQGQVLEQSLHALRASLPGGHDANMNSVV